MRAGPADFAEQAWQPGRATCAAQPEPAIRSRPEGEIVATEQAEGLGDVMCTQGGDVGTDQHRRAGRTFGEGAPHPFAEIAPALSRDPDSAGPEPPAMTGAVGRDSD